MQPTTAAQEAAADTHATGTLARLEKATSTSGQALEGVVEHPKITPHEITGMRTAASSTTLNADGTLTRTNYLTPKFFQKNGDWVPIDTALQEDKNAGDSVNPLGKALGLIESLVLPANNFIIKDNSWQARFGPSDFAQGMVRVRQGNDQVGFSPVNASRADPVITTAGSGQQVVHYYNLWPGVDVEYRVASAEVKENIVLKNKAAASSVAFTVLGATLQKQDGDPQHLSAPYYAIKGALGDQFNIAAPTLMLNNLGPVTDGGVLGQSYRNGAITVSIDTSYLQSLPDNAFPAVIDPTMFYSTFGTRASGSYTSFKSDGYVCSSTTCNPYAGSLYDSSNVLRYWRSAVYAPYAQIRDSGGAFISANLHLVQRTNAGFWTGNYDTHTFYAGHATCNTGFNCLDGGTFNASGTFATAGDINVTSIYQARINAGDWNAWLMLGGEDGTTSSFKNFDPGTGTYDSGSYVSFTYGGPPAAPSMTSPLADQVYADPQPSFSVNYEPNPNGSTPLQYEFLVSSGTGTSGALIASGRQNATQWTMPDNILQDGSTYYIQVRAYDPITGTTSNWGTSVAFHINMRTGKDKSQTYDTLGPVSADLATGNLATSAASHASAALGGSLGVTLSYNSPLKSRTGLVGQYWNNGSFAGDPVLTRVDQNVDFNWDTGSPASGTVPDDNFSVRWKGYFVAPQTGSYQFGSDVDDGCRIWANDQLVLDNWTWCGTQYGTAVTLVAGQAVKLQMDYREITGNAVARLKVKGVVDANGITVPSAWLQTGVRPVATQHGLTGSYFARLDGTNTFSANNYMVMKRVDPYLSFDWGTGPPVPGGPSDFLVRWSGYITVPVGGTYNFGSRSDDGSKITVGTGNTPVLDDWTTHAAPSSPAWGSGYALAANTPTPITIEYYDQDGDQGGAASYQFWAQSGTAVPQQIVPSSWLTPNTQILPGGWALNADAGGNANYNHLTANQNSVIMTDTGGGTHEYTWANGGYKPPLNEDGNLVRNADGSFTLQDADGQTYVFGTDGTLTSVTSSIDDRNPAALQYAYRSDNGGPVHLYQIKDGVDPSRNATLYYGGNSACGTPPATFDIAAPAGMLCAVQTNDGRTTYFYYMQGQLARVARPGNDLTDYRYEVVNNPDGSPIGYRLNAVRDSLAMDVVAAGGRADDNTASTTISYDNLGRAFSITEPAPTAGATPIQHTIEYLPGAKSYVDANGSTVPGYAGMTREHVVGGSEPNGYTQRIKYDALFRTVESTGIAGLSVTSVWDDTKDLLYSSTDPTGLMSTTTYDDEDRAVASYGPAPKAWFDTTNPKNQVPLSAYASQVPHAASAYDENIVGPAVAWFDYTKLSGNTSGALTGAPKLHATGMTAAASGVLSNAFTSPPVTASSGAQGIGFSATGKLRLPNGTYTISADTSDGIRVWVDDQLVLDQWVDSAYRTVTGTGFAISDSTPKRFRVDVYRLAGSTGTLNVKIQQGGGFAATTDWSSYLKPDYSLPTGATTYDSALGNSSAAVNYGTAPELGLARTVAAEPAGLNLTTTSTYEQPGAAGSFNRQTSKDLPGNPAANPSFSYGYYGATETRQNPCDTTQTYKQAGMLKLKTQASPDGGTTPGLATEAVYDDAGRVVAGRTNGDPWTCTAYDSRGRVSTVSIPAFNGAAARTVSHDYAVAGDPLETTAWDGGGWVVNWTDLLGRTVRYRDVHDDETTTSYDNLGKVTQRVSPAGTETYDYDSLNRPIDQKLDGTVYAAVTYDQYSRVDHVDYPNGGQMKATPARDALGRTNALTYGLSTSAPGPNLVPNPSLEQAVTDPSTPDQWHANAWGANTATLTYAAGGHTGSHSGRVDMTSYTDGDAKWYFDPVNISGNTSYTFSDYYQSSISTSVIVQYTYPDGSNTYQWIGDPAASSSAWSQASYTFTSPATATKASIFHIINAVGWLQTDDMVLQATHAPASVSDTVAYTQSNRIQTDLVQSGSNQLSSAYAYDTAGRLTGANIGPHAYTYGFGAQSSGCGTAANMNPDAGKNGNRTSQTVDGATTTYCYDYADRLVSSSDPTASYTEYDPHGSMTYIGTGTTPLRLCYDSSDRNTCMVSYDSSGNGTAMYYGHDLTGRLTYREKDNVSAWNWNLNAYWFYGYTGSGDSPAFIRDANRNIIEKTLHLPGGVMLTVKPQQTGNSQRQYTLPSMLGRTLLTTDANGVNTSTGNGPLNSYVYDPFGNAITGTVLAANTVNGSYGYGGSRERLTETDLALKPILMGARIYLPTIGRFTSVDPVEGGTANSYVYALDPINFSDYSGRCILQCTVNTSALQPAAGSMYVQATVTISRIQSSYAATLRQRIVVVAVRAAAKPAARAINNSTVLPTATVSAASFSNLKQSYDRAHPSAPEAGLRINYVGGVTSASHYYNLGKFIGGSAGCIAGGAITIEAGGAGCLVGGPIGGVVGGVGFGAWGFIEGAFNLSGANNFDYPGFGYPGPMPWQ